MNNTSIATGIVIAIILIVVTASFFFGINIFTLFSPKTNATTQSVATQPIQKIVQKTVSAPAPINKLSITNVVVGTGTVAKSGDTISVQYVGKFTDGKTFDSSAAHGGKPFSFVLGAGQVITGWDKGIVGMKVGGTRILEIPPALGYGNRTVGPIPANSALIFEVKLLNVSAPKK